MTQMTQGMEPRAGHWGALDSKSITRPMAEGSGRGVPATWQTRLPRSVACSVELGSDVGSYPARAFPVLKQLHQRAAPSARPFPATQLAKHYLRPSLPTVGTLRRAVGKA